MERKREIGRDSEEERRIWGDIEREKKKEGESDRELDRKVKNILGKRVNERERESL